LALLIELMLPGPFRIGLERQLHIQQIQRRFFSRSCRGDTDREEKEEVGAVAKKAQSNSSPSCLDYRCTPLARYGKTHAACPLQLAGQTQPVLVGVPPPLPTPAGGS
jgi:hypothetical protein